MIAPPSYVLLAALLCLAFHPATAIIPDIPDIPEVAASPSPSASPSVSPSSSQSLPPSAAPPSASPEPSPSLSPSPSPPIPSPVLLPSPVVPPSAVVLPTVPIPSPIALPSLDLEELPTQAVTPDPLPSAEQEDRPPAPSSILEDADPVSIPSEDPPLRSPAPPSAPSADLSPGASPTPSTSSTLSSINPVPDPASSVPDPASIVLADESPVPESSVVASPLPSSSIGMASASPTVDVSDGALPTDASEPAQTQITPQPTVTPPRPSPSSISVPAGGVGAQSNSTENPEDATPASGKSCVRDVSKPRPSLGVSASRYAFSVFASAAAVALANMLYKLAATWETHENHMAVRLTSILLARLCILFSVKLSSALVAVTANSPGGDNGADVGGAYLTWASAILSSLYHESVMMTFIATGYVLQTETWYPNLRVYLSPWCKHLRSPEGEGADLQKTEESNDSSPNDQVRSRYQALTLFQRIKGGRIDRHLLILTALLYVAMELITLIISLLQLLKDLSGTAVKESIFVDVGESAETSQCPIRISDLAVCFATVAVQGVYVLTRQQSLVPLMALTSELKLSKRKNPRRLIWILRWVTWAILLLWVTSLLCLPLLRIPMEPLFIVGDVSLFWYVMIAPPSYRAASFIVTALFSVSIALIGSFLVFRVGRSSARVHEN